MTISHTSMPEMQTLHNNNTNSRAAEWSKGSLENSDKQRRRGSWFSLPNLDKSRHEQMSLDLSMHEHEEDISITSVGSTFGFEPNPELEVEFQDRQVLHGKGRKVRRSVSLGDLGGWKSMSQWFSQGKSNSSDSSATQAESYSCSPQGSLESTNDQEAWDSLTRQLERSQESGTTLGEERDLEQEIVCTKLTLADVQTENDHHRKRLRQITEERDTLQEEYKELKIRYQQAIQEVMELKGHGESPRKEASKVPTSLGF